MKKQKKKRASGIDVNSQEKKRRECEDINQNHYWE
jgi:hypothetical protein